MTALAVLVLGEVGAGVLAPRLHETPLFHIGETDFKVEQMQALGPTDVVFVGSSVVGIGVDPAVVAGESGLSMYNAAQVGASPPMLRAWLEAAVLPELEPSVVVVGLTSYEFYDITGAALRDSFLSSRGYRMLKGEESVMDRANRWMSEHTNLWRYRGDLRKPKSVLSAILGRQESIAWDEITDATGHFDPDEVPPGMDKGGTPLPEWTINDEAVDELYAMLETIQDSGAQIVLVGMPIIDPYVELHGHGEDDIARYEEALRELAADTDLPLLYYGERDTDLFVDRVHMSAEGAEIFSRQLSADLQRLGVLDGEWVPSADGFGSPSAPALTFTSRG